MAEWLKIPRFNNLSEFQTWWESPDVKTFLKKYPHKLAVLSEHPWVKPYLENLRVNRGEQLKTFGKYQIIKKLGEGGMGEVFLAYDTNLDRKIALKRVILKDENAVKRFAAEARTSAKLKHPHILPIYEIGTVGEYHYFTMEYIEGQSLDDIFQDKSKHLNPKDLARIIRDIVLALASAHKQGIIHRDIKPSNILIDKNGTPYLSDFGLAKEISKIERSLTVSGIIIGTPDYMSPEQAMALKNKIKQTSDIFSIGVTLYHGLTGYLPFKGNELYQILDQIIHKDPVQPNRLIKDLDKNIETICLKCLEKEPHKRYQSAESLADDLSRFLQNEPIKAKPISSFTRLFRYVKQNKPLSILIMSIILIAAIFIRGYIWLRKESDTFNLLKTTIQTELDSFKKTAETKQRAKIILDRTRSAKTPGDKIKIAEESLQIDSDYGDAYQEIADAYKALKNYDKAYQYYSEAIKKTPTLVYSYYERGLISVDIRNSPAGAIEDFNKVIEYDPNSYIGYYARGTIEFIQKQYEQAIKCFNSAINIYPNYGDAYYKRGQAYFAIKELSKTIADWEKFLELVPEHPKASEIRKTLDELKR